MTSLLALLCLGLSIGTRTPVKAGNVLRPILWAEPGSVVPWGTSMTLWCQGNSGSQEFRLVETSLSQPWDIRLTLKPGNKAKFSVPSVTEAYAGTYECYYLSPTGWSEHSEPLELVVTGFYDKPFLSAFPSLVVASGETVTLQCDSWLGHDTFVLTQEGDPETCWKLDSQQLPTRQRQALFQVGPVTPDRGWSFQCYGFFSHTPQKWSHPSDPLQLQVSGTSRRPSLLSPKGRIMTPGQTPTLQCHSKDAYETFALYKENSKDITQHPGYHHQAGLSQANFTLGPVSASHGGQYRCIGRHGFTSLWSEPSDPVDILVAGQLFDTPALSVEPGPSLAPGGNVTLLCQSSGWMDTFLLAKDGAADSPLCVKVAKTEAITQAQFSFHPVTSAHNGTYRCYSSSSFSPYRLSHPSDPLQLQVSGPSGDSRAMSTAVVGEFLGHVRGRDKTGDQGGAEEGDRKDEWSDREARMPSVTSACVLHSSVTLDRKNPGPLLIGLSTAGALLGLFLLLFLLFLLHRRCQAGHHKSRATHSAPQDTGLNTRSRPGTHIQENGPGDSYGEDR
ncbi:leukocyte immunoglobulin-like receptor subfamily A member 6 [Suncus etruscus]|uniref:leukocyte immunoglobulin-like receptor subfamily A member 6 n=1 Tax=Suncus etruscus TaxID=109475 RepID=UPI002110763D|nr:leukocyte immunoglobulin-like receptor subfamily A member 6 [Suncus etruscus]